MSFSNAIFAGGGSRCFWQLGFWLGARQSGLALQDSVRFAASTSAGCVIAATALLQREQEALGFFKAAAQANERNVRWRNLFGRAAGVSPRAHVRADDARVLHRRRCARARRQRPRVSDRALSAAVTACAGRVVGLQHLRVGKTDYRSAASALDAQSGVHAAGGEQPRGGQQRRPGGHDPGGVERAAGAAEPTLSRACGCSTAA